jgi:hypothetical protein
MSGLRADPSGPAGSLAGGGPRPGAVPRSRRPCGRRRLARPLGGRALRPDRRDGRLRHADDRPPRAVPQGSPRRPVSPAQATQSASRMRSWIAVLERCLKRRTSGGGMAVMRAIRGGAGLDETGGRERRAEKGGPEADIAAATRCGPRRRGHGAARPTRRPGSRRPGPDAGSVWSPAPVSGGDRGGGRAARSPRSAGCAARPPPCAAPGSGPHG